MDTFKEKELLYQIAKYYYMDQLSQDEIFKKTNISRPQISRLLKKARAMGIVRIDVLKPQDNKIQNLKQQLLQRTPLKHIFIIPDSLDEENIYRSLADLLSRYLLSFQKIGIGWNEYLYNSSFFLKEQNKSTSSTFYPLVGSLGIDIPFLQVNAIIDRFATQFAANAFFNNYPTLINTQTIDQNMQAHLENIVQKWEGLDCAVIGIGGKKEANAATFIKEISSLNEAEIRLDHVFGLLLCWLFTEDYKILDYPGCYVNCIPLPILQKIPHVVGVSFGAEKADLLLHCISNRYCNELVTDESTAQALLGHIRGR